MSKTMEITSVLRWLRADEVYVLQQAWQCIETGEIEWKDVPKVPSDQFNNFEEQINGTGTDPLKFRKPTTSP